MLKNYLMSSVPMFAAPGGEEGSAAPAEETQQQEGQQAASDSEKEQAAQEGQKEEGKSEATVEAAEGQQQEPEEDWRDKELRRKHAKLKTAETENERLKRENEDLRTLASKPAEERQEQRREEIPATERIQAEAERRVRFQMDLERTNETGEKTYAKTWAKALENLEVLGLGNEGAMPGILATDDPAKVLHELGTNPKEYHRIMSLSPERRQTEFVKIALKEAPKPKVSEAPAPTESVRAIASPSTEPNDKDDDTTWYAKRAAQKKARWEARQAR